MFKAHKMKTYETSSAAPEVYFQDIKLHNCCQGRYSKKERAKLRHNKVYIRLVKAQGNNSLMLDNCLEIISVNVHSLLIH